MTLTIYTFNSSELFLIYKALAVDKYSYSKETLVYLLTHKPVALCTCCPCPHGEDTPDWWRIYWSDVIVQTTSSVEIKRERERFAVEKRCCFGNLSCLRETYLCVVDLFQVFSVGVTVVSNGQLRIQATKW